MAILNAIKGRMERESKPTKVLIEDCDFSVRTYNCLQRAGIKTLGDIKSVEVEINEKQLKELGLVAKRITGYERVKKNGTYYFNDILGNALESDEDNVSIDEKAYDNGNYYTDRKIAENNARADRLMRKLRQWQALNDEPISNYQSEKWTIRYNYCENDRGHDIGLEIHYSLKARDFGAIYFTTCGKAREAIEVFGDELTWYFTEYQQRLDETSNWFQEIIDKIADQLI